MKCEAESSCSDILVMAMPWTSLVCPQCGEVRREAGAGYAGLGGGGSRAWN